MKIIITGVAGFIGFHTAKYFHSHGFDVIGIDNIGSEDVAIKKQRLAQLTPYIDFFQKDITDSAAIEEIFRDAGSDVFAIVHLAAKAGVRESFDNPQIYTHNNITGFNVVIEAARKYHKDVPFVYASSSSVYGDDDVPKSFYGVTKVANELTANLYTQTYDMTTTGLRFFTVYGEWMRPDLAIYKFTDAIKNDKVIRLFNHGENYRDFTYIDDVVQSIELAISRDVDDDDKCAVFDIGNGEPVKISTLVATIEKVLERKAKKWLELPKKGDSLVTCADIEDAQEGLGYYPVVPLNVGLMKFLDWFTRYDDHAVEKTEGESSEQV